jgi:hypothetical protein
MIKIIKILPIAGLTVTVSRIHPSELQSNGYQNNKVFIGDAFRITKRDLAKKLSISFVIGNPPDRTKSTNWYSLMWTVTLWEENFNNNREGMSGTQ